MKLLKYLISAINIVTIISGCSADVEKPDKNNKEYFYIIVIGQSNAAGKAPVESSPGWLKSSNYQVDNYYVWNSEKNIFQPYQSGVNVGTEINSDNHLGFDIFSPNYLLINTTSSLLYQTNIRQHTYFRKRLSRSGQMDSILTSDSDNERSMISELNIKLENAQRFADMNDIKLTPVAVLLHQGESDTSEGSD